MLTRPEPRVLVSVDPLGFAAGERAAGAVERQVVEPDLAQVIEPPGDLVEDPRGHLAAVLAVQLATSSTGLADRQGRQLGDVDAADANGQRLGRRARPVAVGTGPVAPPSAEEDLDRNSPALRSSRGGIPHARKAASGRPSITISTCSGVSWPNGTLTGTPSLVDRRSRSSSRPRWAGVDQGAIAPSRIDRDGSGTIRSRSSSMAQPNPSQPGRHPADC